MPAGAEQGKRSNVVANDKFDVVGIIALVRQYRICLLVVEQFDGLFAVGPLTSGQDEAGRVSQSISRGVNFGAESAS